MFREPRIIVTASSSNIGFPLWSAVQNRLAVYDNRGNALPQLAVELPSLARGTWVVRPDGTMQTVYRIRPGITWHDGAPLTAQDFVFGWTVVMDPDLPVENRAVAQEIASIETPDELTLVIEWKALDADANAIYLDDIGPLPAHLLKSAYEADKDQLWRSPYWTRGFVGVGPFKLLEWELGSQVLIEAYDGYFGGRPKIDRLTIKFIPNVDTIVANILAGTVDWTSDLKFEQSTAIKRQWEAAGLKPTAIVDISALRYVWIQYREPVFRGLLDARVRRGLLSALDRQALSDGLFEGLAPVADTFIPPDDARWDWFRDVAVAYPHDERRAEELFSEAGLRRESDRIFADMGGTRMVLPQWTNDGPPGPQEIAITADQWRAFGVPTEQTVLAPSQQQDRRLRASFPALFHNSWSRPNWVNIDGRLDSANCASDANQWNGLNQGCYVNPAADQILGRLKGAFDPEAQRPLYRDLMKLYTEELPLLPLYFSSNIILARQGLTGLKGKANPEGGTTWNIGEWDVD